MERVVIEVFRIKGRENVDLNISLEAQYNYPINVFKKLVNYIVNFNFLF